MSIAQFVQNVLKALSLRCHPSFNGCALIVFTMVCVCVCVYMCVKYICIYIYIVSALPSIDSVKFHCITEAPEGIYESKMYVNMSYIKYMEPLTVICDMQIRVHPCIQG